MIRLRERRRVAGKRNMIPGSPGIRRFSSSTGNWTSGYWSQRRRAMTLWSPIAFRSASIISFTILDSRRDFSTTSFKENWREPGLRSADFLAIRPSALLDSLMSPNDWSWRHRMRIWGRRWDFMGLAPVPIWWCHFCRPSRSAIFSGTSPILRWIRSTGWSFRSSR